MRSMQRIFFAGIAVFILASCQALFYDSASSFIEFSASTGNDVLTRTYYAGEEGWNNNIERINWDENDPVCIYMGYWKESASELENTDHIDSRQYIVTSIKEAGEKSLGKLKYDDDLDKPLTWKGEAGDMFHHQFYSVYPSSYGGSLSVADAQVSIDFPTLENQDGSSMKYAYMAAVSGTYDTKDDKNYEGTVDLNYYPMVTTIYVTLSLKEDAAGTVTFGEGAQIKLFHKSGDPLVGPFSAHAPVAQSDVSGRSDFTFTTGNGPSEISCSIEGETITKANTVVKKFFILPKNYSTDELRLTLPTKTGTSTFSLYHEAVKQLKPCQKYNINVVFDEEGNPEPPKFEDLSNGGVQMLLQYLNYILNTTLFEDFLTLAGINNSGNQWVNYVFDRLLRNNTNGNLSPADLIQLAKDYDNNTNKEPQQPKECRIIELLQVLFDNVEELTITGNGGVYKDLKPQDFQIYKNLKKVNIRVENNANIKIELKSLPLLTDITITGNAGALAIEVEDCKVLKTIDVSALDQNTDRTLSIKNCGELTTVKKNNRMTVTATGCPKYNNS